MPPANEASPLSKETLALVLAYQQNEVTEAQIYQRIAARTRDKRNRLVLERIAAEEERHAAIWKGYTLKDLRPKARHVLWYTLIARLFGFTFAVKLMEKGEEGAQRNYEGLARDIPEATQIRDDEKSHEEALLAMLDEERLGYVGSMVLGLNDAMVEMSGSLAGLSFALQNTRLIALAGIITGIAATLSMTSSEYLSVKSEQGAHPLKSALYTGGTYVIVVAFLVLPYLLFDEESYSAALACMVGVVLLILLVFNYYLSVAQSTPFGKRFLQMAAISLGVAALSFVLGIAARAFLGIDI
ncbi:MAG: VIT1/CCC1 transporter family protein [Coriobacteriaceae bacterium]|nr:VIT1/CCC1 transporter family protein [Coriobacteriaceae bacterium]